MTDIEIIKALFLISAVEWGLIFVLFLARFTLLLLRPRGRVPFLAGQVVIGLTNLAQAIAYTVYLYFDINDTTYAKVLIYSIPGVLIFKGVAYILVTVWVFNTTPQLKEESNAQ